MADYDNIPPTATLQPSRFKVHIPQQQLDDLRKLVELSRLGPKTWENSRGDGKFGVSWGWVEGARRAWIEGFDWRAVEAKINSFTNYEVAIRDEAGDAYAIHFIGLFSRNPDAVPVVFLHGWPGSFMEFLKILNLLREKYSPDELPYHVIVPSLPGYAFSTGPSLDKEWRTEDIALIINKLMVGLGFGDGYVAQGGDIGSRVARILGTSYEACKAIHLNFNYMPEPKGIPAESISELEQKGIERYRYTCRFGIAYAKMHGTRPATLGMVLSSSPLALLAWIGEKFLEWTDTNPSLDEILASVTLYWLTSTQPRAMYTYVQESGDIGNQDGEIHSNQRYFCEKPMGYSYFPMDLLPVPIAWVKTTGNLVWHRVHDEGGHFAAMEKPHLLLQDLEEFIEELK